MFNHFRYYKPDKASEIKLLLLKVLALAHVSPRRRLTKYVTIAEDDAVNSTMISVIPRMHV